MKDKYLWYTDTHLDKKTPWAKANFFRHLKKEDPTGIFLTGDISSGAMLTLDLTLLAKSVNCPIYFVLGNHDYWFSSFEETHDKVRKLCQKYTNLVWLTESDVIHLTPDVALIGAEGWYDVRIGDPKYLKPTFDWMLIKDFRKLSSWEKRVELFRQKSEESCHILVDKIEKCIEQKCKNIYLLTHVPPWKEATRDEGTFMEKIWLPYNVNLALGKAIEESMEDLKKRQLTVLCGHTHTQRNILVSRNVNCLVGDGNYVGFAKNSNIIYI